MQTILVIDDIDYVRKNVRRVLEANGYKVLEACDGIEGSKVLDENKIDLIILDIIMPKKGGIETLFEVHKKLNHTKVIIMTGKVVTDSDAFLNLTMQFGATLILHKPFKQAELLEKVRIALTGNK